ncbi:uncharacterized protein LOC130729063 [Lotus japonicus]|uniref:uncharacterized protein LOC130729063 n=1 Tax=Lotus japonicus TaxID=34305 RepID=UPI00258A8E5C|nr:uncharacterized protein LOC130729063 [Lotus japonicus]
MVVTRANSQGGDDNVPEKEELRVRMELNEARTKRVEDAILENETRAKRIEDSLYAVLSKLGITTIDDTVTREIRSECGVELNSERDKGGSRWRKLEIPIFGGEDAYGWIHKLERYFELRGVADDERMQATLLALEGKALSWFQWCERCNPTPTWEGFKLAVIRRFQPAMVQNPFELLLSLKQSSTVEAYVEEFERYVGALKEIDQDFAKGIFLNGLKEEIRVEVKLYDLPTLTTVIQKSLMIEQKNLVLQKSNPGSNARGNSFYRNNSFNKVVTFDAKVVGDKKVESTPSSSISSALSTGPSLRSGDYRQLTNAEIKEKREKRLCFRCDEPFSRDHKCKNKQLRMIIMEEEDEEENIEMEAEEGKCLSSLQLSLHSMAGFTSAKSWKVKGVLNGQEVIILIDCGASHNFVSQEIVAQLKLPITPTATYTVEVGDGFKISCQGRCDGQLINIQGVLVQQKYYLFGLKGIDFVLGLDWLAGLGEVKADFGKLQLTIKQGADWKMITGDPALTRSQVSMRTFMNLLRKEGEGWLLHITSEGIAATTNPSIPTELVEVLGEFDAVFQDIQGLPPTRKHDHAIHLKTRADIPNLRPYKIPHFQKSEVENMVQEMLNSGIIRPSISPFASPIILVKKKDGGWRFCVDYRALNKVTIPNKFPILVIEELLDEIGGATVFSKLDLKSGYHQIKMRDEDVAKTAFRTHEGHYEFLVMPFGLTNAPSTFQALMNDVLKPFLRKFVLVFFDDILVYSKSMEAHTTHLQQVLAVLDENSLSQQEEMLFWPKKLGILGPYNFWARGCS